MNKNIGCFLVICMMLLFSGQGAHGELLVDLKARAVVQGSLYTLSDVAEFLDSTDDQDAVLKELSLGRSPFPGEQMVLSRSQLIQALKSRGVSADRIRFTGEAETVIEREKQMVSSEKIKSILTDYILEHMPWPEKDVEIQRVTGTRNLILPGGALEFKVTPQRDTDYIGQTPFRVSVQSPGGEEKEIWVNADIRVYLPAVVARHPIARSREIGREDVVIKRENLASLPEDRVSSIEEVVGQRSRRQIKTGEPIRRSQVEIPPAVRRGDLVTLKVEDEIVLITAKGKVLENGRPGEIIRVMNIASKKEIYGQVINSGTVKVGF